MKLSRKSLDDLAGRIAAHCVSILWQKSLGPIYSRFTGTICRFHPSCSQYAIDALRHHGLAEGKRLATNRVKRCNSTNTESCLDPVE
ncbi:MAG: membrane protein insertion efficiency factor YidD [Fimbriimonadaceae bacterium]